MPYGENDAIYEAELNRALSEAESDFENGRYVEGFDEAWKRINELRGSGIADSGKHPKLL